MNSFSTLLSTHRKEVHICTSIIIQGVPVLADPDLSPEAIRKIVMELIQSWVWEGRPLGKIELICDKTWIHIVTYEQPSNQVIPWKNCTDEE